MPIPWPSGSRKNRAIRELRAGKREDPFCGSFFLLLRAQKKKQEKGTPTSPGPAGCPCFSPRAGRGKTRASPSNSSRVFFRPRLRGAAGQMGEKRLPLARSRAPERLPKRGFALFERKPSLQSPGSIEEYPMRGINSGHPAFGGTSDTGPFLWFVSLGKQRNEHPPLPRCSFPALPRILTHQGRRRITDIFFASPRLSEYIDYLVSRTTLFHYT
jgi:hypothetical protein